MTRLWVLAGLCLAIGIFFAARARGDVQPPEELPHEAVESDLEPAPPSANIAIHVGSAFVPGGNYDPGPSGSLWQYSDLTPEEKALVDRNKNAEGWQGVQDSYATAARDRAEAAAALAAEHQLGLEDGEVGVIP